ncbi:hypothetical protein P8452_72244 [Trifolium repens]|nr:hypothetical protein P8452_72244 [Trifolium repens]
MSILFLPKYYGFIGLDWIGLDWIRQINVHIPIFSLNLSLSPSILFYRSFNGFSHPLPQSLLLLLLLLGDHDLSDS